MKGSESVIAVFNELLAGELSAADQYFIHSRMYDDWGYSKLYERIEHEREEELQHADALIKRILFLEGVPNMSKRDPLKIGNDVPSMLKNDLEVEYQVVNHLRKAIKICEEASDYVSRDILLKLLDDTEEDHTYWLEKQLGLIQQISLENYLQSQM